MNTYRRCKAKKKLKRGELLATLIDGFRREQVKPPPLSIPPPPQRLGKPVHVPTEADSEDALQYIYGIDEGNGKDYSASLIMGGMANGRMCVAAMVAKNMQDRHKKFSIVVRNLRELDYFVEYGIQPSSIHMVGEEDCEYIYHEFRITPDGIVKA